MRLFSYLDPMLDLEYTNRILKDIEELIQEKNNDLVKGYKKWEKENESEKQKNEEHYYAMQDDFIDERYFVSELEANLLSGLAVTLNTIFETHIRFFVRMLSEKNDLIVSRDRPAYKMRELVRFMRIVEHPNLLRLDPQLLRRLKTYTDIRNFIVHDEGIIKKDSDAWKFITENKSLFDINEGMKKAVVKGEYIRKVTEDVGSFFKLLAYTDSGDVIYY